MRASLWALLPLALATMSLIGVVIPQRHGPVALLAVTAPYAYGMVLVLLTPLAVLRRDALLAAALGVAATIGVLAYPELPQPDVTAGPVDLTVLTWNLHGEAADAVGLAEVLERSRPDIVVLQEAGPDAALLLEDDMTVLRRSDAATPPGLVLASRFAVRESGEVDGPLGTWDRPRALWLEVDAPGGPLTFVGVHLRFPAPIDSLPCPYCPDRRDRQVAALARMAAEVAGITGRVIVAGDFNMVEREVAYADFSGLNDAARGFTWRPFARRWFPPLLRLDYVFIGEGIESDGSEVACGLSSSDHCPLWVRIRSQ